MKTEMNPGPVVLASIISSYPDENFRESVVELLEDESISLPSGLRSALVKIVESDETVNDLRSEYIAIFDHSRSLNPLYETEYGRERAMFKANELSDVAAFYRAFGFEMGQDEGTREMVDHVSVELEFYSLMQMKHAHLLEIGDVQGSEIVIDGMKKFLTDHLGRFVGSIAERPGVIESSFYREVFNWIAEVLKQECQQLEVKPDQATWFSSQVESGEVCCGGTVGINK